MKQLRRLELSDHDAVQAVYRQAVLSCSTALYSHRQREAWARQADELPAVLRRGTGLVALEGDGSIAGFGLRDPDDRIALLYGRPDCQRRGHGRRLLRALEQEAQQQGIDRLRTEASLISIHLFEQEGWQRSWQEELRIQGVAFRRFRLHKPLAPILNPWPKPSSSSSSTKCGS